MLGTGLRVVSAKRYIYAIKVNGLICVSENALEQNIDIFGLVTLE
jgi:hypothetical protein